MRFRRRGCRKSTVAPDAEPPDDRLDTPVRGDPLRLVALLIFSASGWRRIGVVGRVQKTVDLELILPTTGERAFVQVKSHAGNDDLQDYAHRFDQAELYDRMFFVWHTGTISGGDAFDGVTLVGPERLSRMVLDGGLAAWLREKVS